MSQAGRSTRSSAASSAAVAATAEEDEENEEEDKNEDADTESKSSSSPVPAVTAAAAAAATTTEETAAMEEEVTQEKAVSLSTAETTVEASTSRKRKAEELSTTTATSTMDAETETKKNDDDGGKDKEGESNKKMKNAEPEADPLAVAAAASEKEAEEKSKAKEADEQLNDTDTTTKADAVAENSTNDKKAEAESSVATAATTAMEEAASTAAANETTEPEETSKAAEEGKAKHPYDSLKYILVRNDGKPESMIKLVGLKSLFAKQLPKMPRAYIARLVFDPRHTSLAILSENPKVRDSDDEIIGAICYRAFDDMRFAEIAFCAVNATHQVKGYGTKLMTLLKKIGAEQQPVPIEYYITYADNYAIGYFKKQGFSKSIQMPRGRYFGLIKEYDGGTPMECYVHPSCDFTRVPEMLEAQRNFILSRIEQVAMSKTIYPPIGQLKDDSNSLTAYNSFASSIAAAAGGANGSGSTTTSVAALVAASANGGVSAATAGSRGNQSAARAMAVPGMEQAGWTMADLMAAIGQGKESDRQKTALKTEFLAMIRKIEEQHFAWPFREPVDTNEVPDYLDVIKEPIDLSTIDKRIRQDNHYKSKQMLYQDLMLMVNNCKLYNEPASPYAQCASSLETYLGQLFRKEDIAGRG